MESLDRQNNLICRRIHYIKFSKTDFPIVISYKIDEFSTKTWLKSKGKKILRQIKLFCLSRDSIGILETDSELIFHAVIALF